MIKMSNNSSLLKKLKGPFTKNQQAVFDRLIKEKSLYWIELKRAEVVALKSFVNRCIAEVHSLDHNGNYCSETYWTLKR